TVIGHAFGVFDTMATLIIHNRLRYWIRIPRVWPCVRVTPCVPATTASETCRPARPACAHLRHNRVAPTPPVTIFHAAAAAGNAQRASHPGNAATYHATETAPAAAVRPPAEPLCHIHGVCVAAA